jgi:hypothetical protein
LTPCGADGILSKTLPTVSITETIADGHAPRATRARGLFAWTLIGWAVTALAFGLQNGAKYLVNGRLRFFDADMGSLAEAILFPTVFIAPGTLVVALALFLPAAAAIRALTRGRLSGWLYSAAVSILPLLVLFGIGFVLWLTSGRVESFADNLARTGPFHIRHWDLLVALLAGGTFVGWATRGTHGTARSNRT